MEENKPIGIIGNGNVAFHFLKALEKSASLHLFVRTLSKGEDLLKEASTSEISVHPLQEIRNFNGHLLLCITDSQLEPFLKQYQFHPQASISHTSGSQPIEILKQSNLANYGVLYPFQSLSKGKEIDFKTVPLLIEGNNAESLQIIQELAHHLSSKVIHMNSINRLKIHLASVLINNFSNNLYHIAENIINGTELELSDFKHLMLETTEKAISIGPGDAQTGPAKRNEQKVMESHLRLLEESPSFRQLYQLHSSLIQSMK